MASRGRTVPAAQTAAAPCSASRPPAPHQSRVDIKFPRNGRRAEGELIDGVGAEGGRAAGGDIKPVTGRGVSARRQRRADIDRGKRDGHKRKNRVWRNLIASRGR